MKIVYITDKFPPEPTTVGNLLANTATALRRHGHEVVVITSRPTDGSFDVRAEEQGIRVIRLPIRRYSGWARHLRMLHNASAVRQVRAVVQHEHPDVIHCHVIHEVFSWGVLRALRRLAAKKVITLHDVMSFHYGKLTEFINPHDTSIPATFAYRVSALQQLRRFGKWYNPFRRIYIRRALSGVDEVFAVSGALRDALTANGIARVQVLPNGIDPSAWITTEQQVASFRSQHHLEGKKVILFGGRLSSAKGGAQMLAAFAGLYRQIPDAMLLIIGQKNAYATELLQQAIALGVDQAIVFTGWLSGDALRAAYHAADVVVAPSVCFDSLPTVILEAMACGRPVVATCFGGASALVAHEATGYIVNPYDTKKLTSYVSGVLQDVGLAHRLGQEGRARLDASFTLEHHVEQLLDVYNRS